MLALSKTEIVDMPQVFFPFAVVTKGQMLYEHVQAHPQFLRGSEPEEA